MKDWIQVVTDPMGLAGFALFLVFTIVAKRGKKASWLTTGAFAMACIALVGGLTLAYFRIRAAPAPTLPGTARQPTPLPSSVNRQAIGEIKQESSGAGAVNAAGVQGRITVNNALPSPTPTQLQAISKRGKK